MKRRVLSGGFLEGKRGKALRPLPVPESAVQRAVCDVLDTRHIVYSVTDAKTVQTVDGARQCVGREGWPDITALLPYTGRFWAIEVKTLTGKLREAQVDMHALIEASGGLVTVARDPEQVNDVIDEHLAQFETRTLIPYFDRIKGLFRAYLDHRYERRQKARELRARKAAKTAEAQLTLKIDLTGNV